MITCTFEKGASAKLRHIVVHALVEKDGCLLMEKRTGDMLETGKWCLPAGFLERDETLTQGILRELLEETGWVGEVVALLRINSNPDRPHEDRQNVAFDFIVKPIRKIGIADNESSKVEWIPIEKILSLGSKSRQIAFDHGESIALYCKYRKKPFPLPLFV